MSDGKDAQKRAKKSVVFVCTGNTCRSPMAEFMFKQYLKDKKLQGGYTVSSAGLYAVRGDAMNANAEKALDFLGVKYTAGRKAKTFTVQMSLDSDLVVGMTARHAEECGEGDNITSFEELGAPVPDPYGGSLQDYIDCAVRMRSMFDAVLARLDGRSTV